MGDDWLQALHENDEARILIWDKSGSGTGFDGFATLEPAWPEIFFLVNLALSDGAKGDGQAFIAAVIDLVFGELQAHRIFCDTAFDNAAGLRAFQHAGFTHEGTIRHCWKRDGIWVDCEALGMLASDWRQLRRQT